MSEAAKSRGTSRVEFAENVASCIVAISCLEAEGLDMALVFCNSLHQL